MTQQLNEHEKAQIVTLCVEKYSYAKIATIFGISKSTVSRVYKKYSELNTFAHAAGNGRPKKISMSVFNVLYLENEKNFKTLLRNIQSIVEERCKIRYSYTTIRNPLNDINLFVFSPLKRPIFKA